MNRKSDEREVEERIQAIFSLTTTVTSKPVGNAFTLIVTLPRNTEEQTLENIAEILDNDGWSFTLRREGDPD